MGVTWSQPKPAAGATKIMIKAAFPKAQTLKSQLWNLWKHYKLSLKQDGFATSCYKKQWYIYYFAEVDETTYEKQTTPDGLMPNYMITFKQKYTEWKEILDELNSIEHLQEPSEPEQESWYFDMELDPPGDDV
jgi:hypothetical protein